MEQQTVEKILLNYRLYQYTSYNHKAAEADYKSTLTDVAKEMVGEKIDSYDIPPNIKKKYEVLRIGKLRSIEFSPSGNIRRVKIGARYPKNYFIEDFGVIVKPIINNNNLNFKLKKSQYITMKDAVNLHGKKLNRIVYNNYKQHFHKI